MSPRKYTPDEKKKAKEIVGRLQNIHDRYTPEAITLRLQRDGYSDLEAAVRAEADKMFAEYRQLDEEFGVTGLADVALKHFDGMERVLEIIIDGTDDTQHRTGGRHG